jgi:hypothetical protein
MLRQKIDLISKYHTAKTMRFGDEMWQLNLPKQRHRFNSKKLCMTQRQNDRVLQLIYWLKLAVTDDVI